MAVPRAVRRLLHVREMEEQESQTALRSAFGEHKRLQAALAAAQTRERNGRSLVAASAATGEQADRVAALEEIRCARRHAAILEPKIRAAEQIVALRRQELLAKSVERRQVEQIVRVAQAEEAREADRNAQREIDDWFLGQTR